MKLKSLFFAMVLAGGLVLPSHKAFTAVKNEKKFQLGQFLFFDKVLSGNKNISCATCHHPTAGFTSDNLSLGLGEGAVGIASSRSPEDKIHHRVPRNSPALFNIGHSSFINYFHDGRVEKNSKFPSGFKTPANYDLPEGLENLLAAQALFPITSAVEMAGQADENSIGVYSARNDFKGVWQEVVKRIKSVPKYVELFSNVFEDVSGKDDIEIVHYANAISHFQEHAFKADEARFDEFQRGDKSALTDIEKRGMKIFYGKGKCSTCHSGRMFTDNQFHSIGLPPIGPGKASGHRNLDDYGRELTTKDFQDRYKFRTPGLRNVTITGPWGHNGAYNSLKDIIKHHEDPKGMLYTYSLDKALLPIVKRFKDDSLIGHTPTYEAILNSIDLPKISLNEQEIEAITKFLWTLTDNRCLEMRSLVPLEVPSKLPVRD